MRKNTNRYVFHSSHVEIVTIHNKSILVSYDDFDNVKLHSWSVDNKGYASAGWNGRTVRLHSFIMNPSGGCVVDHINRNKLDNRRENLRVVPKQVNSWNHKIISTNKSGYNGVYWSKECDKWAVQICRDGYRKHIGLFDSIEKAVLARQREEIEFSIRKYGKDLTDILL